MSTELQFLCLMKFINQQILGANRDYHFSVFSKYLFLSFEEVEQPQESQKLWPLNLWRLAASARAGFPGRKLWIGVSGVRRPQAKRRRKPKRSVKPEVDGIGPNGTNSPFIGPRMIGTSLFDISDGLSWFVRWPNCIESVSHEHEILKGKNKTKLTII